MTARKSVMETGMRTHRSRLSLRHSVISSNHSHEKEGSRSSARQSLPVQHPLSTRSAPEQHPAEHKDSISSPSPEHPPVDVAFFPRANHPERPAPSTVPADWPTTRAIRRGGRPSLGQQDLCSIVSLPLCAFPLLELTRVEGRSSERPARATGIAFRG